ncbi:MAG: sulfatase-like hydrolase/transferase [Verrucomicrobiota bacterium]
MKKWLPNLTLEAWFQLLPLLIVIGMMWIMGIRTLSLSVGTVKFWEYFLYGGLYGIIGYWVGLTFLLRHLRVRWVAAAFAWFYLLLYGVNAAFIYQSGNVLQPYYLWIASENNWVNYLNGVVWMIIILYAASGVLSTWLIYRHGKTITQIHVRGMVLLLVILWSLLYLRDTNQLFRPVTLFTSAIGQPKMGIWRDDQVYRLRTLGDNPVVVLFKAIENLPKPLEVHPTSELSSMSTTLQAWHLPLGPRQYPPLGLKPFNHIVVFATESLSLDFLAPYNTNLPPEFTPFYSSPAIQQGMFVNYQTVALPTQPGLSVTYNSHPNANALLASKDELSLVKYLNAQGYDTYFLMSASKTLNNNEAVLKKFGFQHILSLENWRGDPHKQPFIEGWGLMDRVLYQTALDLLRQDWGKKIYIHVANVDTHGPYPRDYFGTLEYPQPPPGLAQLCSNAQANDIEAGIFRHDYDMGLTIQAMRDQNLLTEDTLVVLTADHNFPHAEALNSIPGYPSTYFSRIPLVFLSGQNLPKVDLKQMHTQLDFAPTMMHLLGLPIPEGWWGQSIFASGQNAPRVAKFDRNLVVELSNGQKQIVSLDNPKGTVEQGLVNLFNRIYVDPTLPSAAVVSAIPPTTVLQ